MAGTRKSKAPNVVALTPRPEPQLGEVPPAPVGSPAAVVHLPRQHPGKAVPDAWKDRAIAGVAREAQAMIDYLEDARWVQQRPRDVPSGVVEQFRWETRSGLARFVTDADDRSWVVVEAADDRITFAAQVIEVRACDAGGDPPRAA
jgi:hypothetical protein